MFILDPRNPRSTGYEFSPLIALAHSLVKRLLQRIEVKVGAGVSTPAFSGGKTKTENEKEREYTRYTPGCIKVL